MGGEALAAESDTDALALAVHSHEPGAFDQLVASFEGPLFRYAERLLQNVFDAQEVVQDALLRAHRALTKQYSRDRCASLALRPWLFRIARNLCLNRRRGKKRAAEQSFDSFDDGRIGPLVPDSGAIASAQKREDLAELDRAIARLPSESRELVVLRFLEEMSYGEIAKLTGSNEASLRGKVFRSLKLLRKALVQNGVCYAL